MKKNRTYYVHDGDKKYEVTEMDDDEIVEEEPLPPVEEEAAPLHDDETLTPAEAMAIKKFAGANIDGLIKLAEHADEILALLNPVQDEEVIENEEKVIDFDGECAEEEEIIDSEDNPEEDEPIGDKKKSHDSFKLGYGSNQNRAMTEDSDPTEDEVSTAWQKRYNGGNL